MSLAKAQGIGNETRGACKLCGGLGHLTKKCTNVLTGHNMAAGADVVARGGAASAAATAGVTLGPGGVRVMGLLPDEADLSDLSDLSSSSSDSSSDSDESSSSSSSSSNEDRKRKRRHKSKKQKKVKGRTDT